MTDFKIEWIDAECESKSSPVPDFPEGVNLIENPEADNHCNAPLTYPAPRCGVWSLTCGKCGKVTVVTAYGRADDPRSIAVACDRRPDNG